MMKPKGQTEAECGMLEYLEDIVGTTRYKEPLVKIDPELTKACDKGEDITSLKNSTTEALEEICKNISKIF